MSTIDDLKEQEAPSTPLFLIDCVLSSGATEHWATHSVNYGGVAYAARVVKQNLFELQSASIDGLDAPPKVTMTFANADSLFSQIERETGFKGAQVTITFLFWDLGANAPASSDARIVFRGIANPPEEIAETTIRLTFNNRLSLQRILLPEVRIERRCPWLFPSTAAQRQTAMTGGAQGKYSPLYRCGYSADQSGGVGNLDGGTAFTTCDYTRASCVQRGMFSTDGSSNLTGRFGGIEFVPPQIQVRGFGASGTQLSVVLDNEAQYNDFVPLVYGTAWYQPPIVFARNDGNLTRMEVLLGMGQIEGVVQVVVNSAVIPLAQSGVDMTATGWFTLVTPGTPNGGFDLNFTDSSGSPLGDPFGSMAYLSVVVPNAISNGQSLPAIEVLIQGLLLESFDTSGNSLGQSFTNNPAWVLLDILRRAGWLTTDIDLVSFATAAAYCGAAIESTDLNGNAISVPRFECNLVIQNSTSAAEIGRGIRVASALILTYGLQGLLTLTVENSFSVQQPALPDGSNSTEELFGGWPAYEFSDGSAAYGGLLRDGAGNPLIRLWSKTSADTPNVLSVEFQDEFNDYQQDSLLLVDENDALLTGREVTATYVALGLPNFDQATRILQLQLTKTLEGYTLIDFQTTVKGIGLKPGDLITITYLKEGLQRQPFRVIKIAPSQNYQTIAITAQWHDDEWYPTGGAGTSGTRRRGGAEIGLPRPLVGASIDANGVDQFGITETTIENSDGSFADQLTVAFTSPSKPTATGVSIPLLSLSPTIATTGGTIVGGQNLYYALTALDSAGNESGLSFTIAATIPSGGNTNSITVPNLSFSSGTAGFNVYRGPNPTELLQIAAAVAVATSFTDSGLSPQLIGPPDENYDHANFYWRTELQPETPAGIFSSTTIGNTSLGAQPDEFQNQLVWVTRGTGAPQQRQVLSNDATTLTVTPAWTVIPDSTTFFTVASGTWNFAGVGQTSPVQIEVPNRTGETVEISGRSANVYDEESAYQLNPLTPWQIGGALGGMLDSDVPPLPVFGLSLVGQGMVELAGIGFSTLVNTHTISAGTLELFSWNELASPSTINLATGIGATDTTITLSAAGPAVIGTLIQIESEILAVTAVSGGGMEYQVNRGSQESTAASHLAGTTIYHLDRTVSIVPFVPDFFGSPASGNYSQSIFIPDVRIGAAQFFVTNIKGGSLVAQASFGATTDGGLRTLAGGQFSIQVEGYLAVETDAAPPLIVQDTIAIRDISAVVDEAPSGAAISLQLRQGSTIFCTLTIPDGGTASNVVSGFGMAPLTAGSQISLDILSVPSAADTLPGQDLSVTIRL